MTEVRMSKQAVLTGAELETLGLMKFACDACRDAFPARCGEHRIIQEKPPEADDRKLELLVRPEQVIPEPKLLPYGKPISEYTAPYERLESEIGMLLKPADDQR